MKNFNWMKFYDCRMKTTFNSGGCYLTNDECRAAFDGRDVWCPPDVTRKLDLKVGDMVRVQIKFNHMQKPECREDSITVVSRAECENVSLSKLMKFDPEKRYFGKLRVL